MTTLHFHIVIAHSSMTLSTRTTVANGRAFAVTDRSSAHVAAWHSNVLRKSKKLDSTSSSMNVESG
eukprot:scaffold2586_cov256-Skeletonema_marinoi.AAC.4